MATIVDDRSELQRSTHTTIVVGVDNFMTKWGRDCGTVGKSGRSLAAWACEPKHSHHVMRWVMDRGDLKRVRFGGPTRLRKGDHLHIYVVTDDHVALEGQTNGKR